MALLTGDSSWQAELASAIATWCQDARNLLAKLALKDPFEALPAILCLSAGTGGLDAQDFCRLLLNMYTSWAKRHKRKIEILEASSADGGIKSVSVLIKGANAYGQLHGEAGVHRLVRFSPFGNKARQTSFCRLEVLPHLPQDRLALNWKEIRVETYRASGPGGQHRNKTESAVRLTHLPTGLTATCASDRSQKRNLESATLVLAGRLQNQLDQERLKRLDQFRANIPTADFAQQRRSYFFHPQRRVKDHLSGIERNDVNAILDGDIDDLLA